jgi:predicted dehydrogenase/threonine dehydrogenase-like Zn-dependent dehydrogenase
MEMKQVFLQNGNIQLHDIDPPLCQEKEVLVKVFYSAISRGTEVATATASSKPLFKKFTNNFTQNTNKIIGAFRKDGFFGTLDLIKNKTQQVNSLGYSCSGQVVKVGSRIEKFRAGDFVACAGAGMASHAEFVVIPENLVVRVNNQKHLKYASLTTIGTIALQGVRRANLQLGEKVCIIGLGLIGQITAQLVSQAGCKVFGVDILSSRLNLAKKLGAKHLINSQEIDIIKEIDFITSHYGVDTTIITAGPTSGEILQQAMQVTRRKGKVVIVGDVPLYFNREPFYSKEIDLFISCSYGPGRYDNSYEKDGCDYPYSYVRWTENRNMQLFLSLVEDKKILIEPLITHEFGIDKVSDAYDCIRKSSSLGVVLFYRKFQEREEYKKFLLVKENSSKKFFKPIHISRIIPNTNSIQVGIVGMGGFCKTKLLPIISRTKNVTVHSVVDVDATNAISIARQYHVKRIANDYRKLAFDDDIHAVIISTPHHFHAKQALTCMEHGKAVFLEKPAAVTFEQLRELDNFVANNPESFLCVDFNRSSSPFIKSIKNIIITRKNPLIIYYRMNAGYIPKSHWIQSKENRGRVIGEACHIFELFCYLTDAIPRSVSVAPLRTDETNTPITDNFQAQVTMSDESCCSLVYTSLGNPSMGKEYMELFFDGKSIRMNDYLELTGYGLPLSFNQVVRSSDKGHKNLLKQFFDVITMPNSVSPTSFDRVKAATELTLIVDELIRSGGGFKKFMIDA